MKTIFAEVEHRGGKEKKEQKKTKKNKKNEQIEMTESENGKIKIQ